MNKVKKLITNNLDIKLLALFMAIILWFYISSEYNITSEKYFEIEVIPINLSNNFSIKEIRDKVSVGIKGPQSIVENLSDSKIFGTINLQNVSDSGEYIIGVNVISPKNTEVVKIIPEEFRVIIEKIISEEYSIDYNLIGLPEKGFSLKEEPELNPKNILVIAPESLHNTIGQARIDIDISSINKDVNKKERVKIYSKDGDVLNDLKINPEEISVSIQVREGYPEKILEIKPRIIGKPAPGYYISKIEANPNSFKVYGEYTKINNIEFLETIPIDVNGISKTLTVKISPNVVEGMYLAENQEILAEVQIHVEERIEEVVFKNLKIEIREASPFINYQLIPETVEVKLAGKQSHINSIKEEDITIFVNLSDTERETVKVEAKLPLEINLIEIFPEEVTVSIKK